MTVPEAAKLGGGDTTYTKVFVGGLAWETQKDTMNNYFQQFGEILEAVVITDKTTGRSKGYGFVTFREADAAMRACVDASPVIDGRRANCNLASLGVQKSTPRHGAGGGGGGRRNIRVMGGFDHYIHGGGFNPSTAAGGGGGGLGTAFTTTFPHYSIQQAAGIPNYNFYGYSPYSAEYAHATSYFGVYGGASGHQYPLYGTGCGVASGAYYPCLNFNEESGGATPHSPNQGYATVQYPHHLFHYSPNYSTALYTHTQHYGTPISVAPPTPVLQSGVNMALHAPIPHR